MKRWKRAGLLFLFIAVLYTLFYSALQSRHLFAWDDRFHALVAANLAKDGRMPKLYAGQALVPYDHAPWYRSYYWLHKPPFFSYQAALTLRLLGNELWAYRLNGALLHSLWFVSLFWLLSVWRMPRGPALLLAAVTVSSRFVFLLANGKMGMDQNDLSFLLYLSLATLFFSRALRAPSKYLAWLFWGSLAMAAAVLTKFLTGFLPFLFLLLMAWPEQRWRRRWPALLATAALPLGAAAAWYAYAYQWAPAVTLRELAYNGRHFWEALEGHARPWYFIGQRFAEAFAPLLTVLVLLGALYGWRRWKRKKELNVDGQLTVAAALSMLFPLLFFSLAQTKLPAYGYIAVLYLLLLIAAVWPSLSRKGAGAIQALLLLFLLPQLMLPYQWSINEASESCRAQYYRGLRDILPEKAVLFRLPPLAYPEVMFYSGRLAYDRHPSAYELSTAVEQGYQPYYLKRAGESIRLEPHEKDLGVKVLTIGCTASLLPNP